MRQVQRDVSPLTRLHPIRWTRTFQNTDVGAPTRPRPVSCARGSEKAAAVRRSAAADGPTRERWPRDTSYSSAGLIGAPLRAGRGRDGCVGSGGRSIPISNGAVCGPPGGNHHRSRQLRGRRRAPRGLRECVRFHAFGGRGNNERERVVQRK